MKHYVFSLLLLFAAAPAHAQVSLPQPPVERPSFSGRVVTVHVGDPQTGEASYIVVAKEGGKRSFRITAATVIINAQKIRLLLQHIQAGTEVTVRYRVKKRGRPVALLIQVLTPSAQRIAEPVREEQTALQAEDNIP